MRWKSLISMAVSECADHGSNYDCMRECAELAVGGGLVVQGWSHRHRPAL